MIKLKNVCFNVFDKEANSKKIIIDNFNYQFKKGKITVITGHNGSGKSTLIKLIMGINNISSGNIFFGEKDITNMSVSERANLGLTMAFQQPVRFKGLTVKNLLDVASSNSNKLADACNYLSKVGLCAKQYINREIDNTLSGGELKRIELALALAKGGEVYLFDEPEAGIDLWSFDELINIFKSLKGKTVIIVSHQKKILEIADEIVLFNGKTVTSGKRDEMLGKLTNLVCDKLSEVKYE